MTDSPDIPYAYADPWLLHAVLAAAGDEAAGLADVIAMGDAINHAVFTYPEVDGGLARLTAGGWIMVEDKQIKPTDKARKLYERIAGRHHTMHKVTDALREQLGAPGWDKHYDPGQSDPRWSAGIFGQDEFNRAYATQKRG